MKKTKEENAITLIALVITIIVLLILAGISINTITGDNGILKMTQQAKVENEIATEKEIVIRSANAALMNTKGEEFSLNDLQKELDIEAGNGKTEASDEGNSYDVIFKDTNRLYTVNKEGDVTGQGEISKDSNPGDIKKNQNNEKLSGDDEEHAYEIASIEDLVQFSKMTNEGNNFEGKYVKITKNLNFNSNYSYTDPNNTSTFGDYNSDNLVEGIKTELTKDGARGFIPIKQFAGTILGQNNKINNIRIIEIPVRSDKYLGFVKENVGNIQDLKLSGTLNVDMVDGNKTMYFIGGACGANEGTMKNIENEIELKLNLQSGIAMFYAGGIAGGLAGDSDTQKEAIIENSTNKAKFYITGVADNRIGGIAGYVDTSKIYNCKNEAYVRVESSDYSCIGGVAGDVYDTTIENSCNIGSLEAISNNRIYLGGISAMDNNLKIKNSYNAGEIISNGHAARMGGITGSSENGTTIENCYNTGKIRTTSNSTTIRVGGLIGFTFDRNNEEPLTVKNSYNAGIMDIQGQASQKGTLYGTFCGTIQNCYALQTNGIELAGSTNDKITTINCATKTAEEMRNLDFVNLLNSSMLKKDSNNINNGYPILIWQ